jgi:rhodanese-related sulfurtransferase
VLFRSGAPVTEITAGIFDRMRSTQRLTIIDVREPGELPAVHEFEHLHIPLQQLAGLANGFLTDTIVVFCQSGVRSRQAAEILAGRNPGQKVFSLQGGILQWKNNRFKSTQHER